MGGITVEYLLTSIEKKIKLYEYVLTSYSVTQFFKKLSIYTRFALTRSIMKIIVDMSSLLVKSYDCTIERLSLNCSVNSRAYSALMHSDIKWRSVLDNPLSFPLFYFVYNLTKIYLSTLRYVETNSWRSKYLRWCI